MLAGSTAPNSAPGHLQKFEHQASKKFQLAEFAERSHASKHSTMAKDKSEKKEKKEKRQSADGVKKEKKDKKDRKSTDATTAILNTLETAQPGAVAVDADGDVIVDAAAETSVAQIPQAALVPFANPLCDEKNGKKVLKTVKKGMCCA